MLGRKASNRLTIMNDNLGDQFSGFLAAACLTMLAVNSGPIYICMSSRELQHLYEAVSKAGGHWSTYVIWAKHTFTLGHSDYQRQFEPILPPHCKHRPTRRTPNHQLPLAASRPARRAAGDCREPAGRRRRYYICKSRIVYNPDEERMATFPVPELW